MEWISVDKQPLPRDKHILASDGQLVGEVTYRAQHKDDDMVFIGDTAWINPTHWMMMPGLPNSPLSLGNRNCETEILKDLTQPPNCS